MSKSVTPSEVKFAFVTETVTSAAFVPSTFATVILFIFINLSVDTVQ